MTTSAEVLVDAIGRVRSIAGTVARSLTPELLEGRLDPEANTIAWLLWHVGRVQDAQVADAAGTDEVWIADGWVDRFGLPFDSSATGYRQSADEVGAVKGIAAELLLGYIEAVCDRTVAYLGTLSESDLDRVVDRNWSPPVTLAARLVSIVSDDLQHLGQAAFIRGVLERT
ncbi:DUF664 domain-containing protein [Gryllotalpicola sp.]|uniref:mycothiol transferase n=1 Tax=Gryllotalpicola sp. TaxID=1932787 RepID=UPI00262CCE3A|nr:DUF664 domain-containing protein [Gryllotalpicola sp.]